MADEKSVKEPLKTPPAAPSGNPQAPSAASPGTGFKRLAMAWAGLCAFAWGATVYCLPGSGTFLWKTLAQAGSIPVRPMLLGAIGVAALVAWVLFVRLKPAMTYLKPGQGTWVRVTGYVGFLVVVLFAAYEIAILPSETSEWWWVLAQFSIAGGNVTVHLSWLPAAAMTTTAMVGYHLFMNREKWSEFMIETQSELRKVNWPATKEWIGSSAVVLIVVVVVSCFLALVDEGLTRVMSSLKIGF